MRSRDPAQMPGCIAFSQAVWTATGLAPMAAGAQAGDVSPYPIAGRVTVVAVQDLKSVYRGAADDGVW